MKSEPTTIKVGAIFDGISDELVGDKTIVIEDGSIIEIRENSKTKADFNYPDCVLVPGLIDAHLHFGIEPERLEMGLLKDLPTAQAIQAVADAWNTLRAGFTAVRLLGTTKGFADIALRDAVRSGVLLGPKIQACGQMIGMTGGHAELSVAAPEHDIKPWATIVDGVEEARSGARKLLRRHVDFLKIVASGGMSSPADEITSRQLTKDEIRVICEEANAVGKIVSAHAQGIGGIRTALEGGVSSIEHGFFLDREAARFMNENDVFLVPTLSVPEEFVKRGADGKVPKFMHRKALQARKASQKAFQVALDEEVPIVVGSDNGFPDMHGKMNLIEMELMVKNGMSPLRVLRAATSVSAHYLGLEDSFGKISPGMTADLVVIKGNPIQDIGAIGNVQEVFFNGAPILHSRDEQAVMMNQ